MAGNPGVSKALRQSIVALRMQLGMKPKYASYRNISEDGLKAIEERLSNALAFWIQSPYYTSEMNPFDFADQFELNQQDARDFYTNIVNPWKKGQEQ